MLQQLHTGLCQELLKQPRHRADRIGHHAPPGIKVYGSAQTYPASCNICHSVSNEFPIGSCPAAACLARITHKSVTYTVQSRPRVLRRRTIRDRMPWGVCGNREGGCEREPLCGRRHSRDAVGHLLRHDDFDSLARGCERWIVLSYT